MQATTWMNLKYITLIERKQDLTVIHCMIPFIQHSRKDKTTVTENSISGCQGLQVVEGLMIKGEHEGVGWSDGTVLNPDGGGGYKDLKAQFYCAII